MSEWGGEHVVTVIEYAWYSLDKRRPNADLVELDEANIIKQQYMVSWL